MSDWFLDWFFTGEKNKSSKNLVNTRLLEL